VSADALRALEAVAADLAASDDHTAFTRRWARLSPPLRAVEVRPWTPDVAGGADVVFAEGAGPTPAELTTRLGGLDEWPPLFSGTRQRAGVFDDATAAGVELVVYGAAADDEALDRVSLHRAWAPPGGWDAPPAPDA